MSYRLFIAPVPEAGEKEMRYDWALQDSESRIVKEGSMETQIAIEEFLDGISEKVAIIGFIPSSDGTLCWATIPGGRYAEKALPYAVENQLAQDIDTLHLASSKRGSEHYKVWAIDHEIMEAWVSRLSSFQGATLSAMYFRSDVMEISDNESGALILGQRVTVAGENAALEVKDQDLSLVFHLLAEENQKEPHALTIYGRARDLARHKVDVDEMNRIKAGSLDARCVEVASPIRFLISGFNQAGNGLVDLCQGKYTLQTNGSGSAWGNSIKYLLTGLVAINLSLYVGMGWYHKHHADQLNDASLSLYQEIYPGETSVTADNLKRVVQGKIKHAEKGTGKLGFVSRMKFLGQAVIANRGKVEIESIRYKEDAGQLIVEISASGYESINGIQARLTESGLRATIGAVEQTSGVTSATLTVSERGDA